MTNNKQPRKGTTMGKSQKVQKSVEVVEETIVIHNELPLDIDQPVIEHVEQRQRPNKDDKGRYKTVDLSMEDIEQRGWKNKSQIIRGLAGENFSPSAIANFLDIRYQHVRNVLTTVMKRGPHQAAATTTTTNKAEGDA